MVQSGAAGIPHHARPGSMNSNTRELFQLSMDLNAKLWDDSVKQIRSPEYVPGRRYPGTYLEDTHYWEECCSRVRETSFYALGLLLRDAPGDRQKAAEALDAVLKQQWVKPGVRWFGTFRRTPEEPDPGPNAVTWRDYDPNWREFIGTTLEMILIEFPDRISPELSERLYKAIDLAVEGEMADGRLVPSYTNPALMYGALWDFAGAHDKRPDWQKQSAEWNESVYSLFAKYDAFTEYNSPTYYGVDLLGLALWRDYGSTERIRTMGGKMEAALWKDVAALYQPDLHNISGPYDRSYGMDMESSVGLVAIWMRTALGANNAPMPPLEKLNGSGLSYVPQVAILGAHIPLDSLMKMEKFQGEHLFRGQITDQRVATAWIGKHVIFGGEATSKTRDVGPKSQFHPVTIQWRTPSGEIGWVQVARSPMIDATADEKGLTISTTGTIRLRIHAKSLVQAKVTQGIWDLPGLRVAIASDSTGAFTLEKASADFNPYFEAPDDTMDVTYPGITKMRLEIKAEK